MRAAAGLLAAAAASGLFVVDARERQGGLRAGGQTAAVAGLEHEAVHDRDRARRASGPSTAIVDHSCSPTARSASTGVLRGSLYLQGGGDPALGVPAFYDRYLGGPRHQPLRAQGRSSAPPACAASPGGSTPTTRSSTACAASPTPATRPAPTSARSRASPSTPATAARSPAASPPTRPRSRPRSWRARCAAPGSRSAPRSALGDTPSQAEPLASGALADDVAGWSRRPTSTPTTSSPRCWSSCSAPTSAAPAPPPPGAAVVERFARGHGSAIQAVDGSGLTRGNRASPLAGRPAAAGDARERGRR